MRFWVSSTNKEFFTDILNIIDIMAIIPFFSDILLVILSVYDSKHSNYNLVLVFRIFRVFRICRVLKLLRHNFSLLALVKTFKYAGADLAYVNVFIFGKFKLYLTKMHSFRTLENLA